MHIFKKLTSLANSQDNKDRTEVDVTIILTIWKRNNVERQLAAIRSQTVKPAAIWLYQCGNYVDVDAYMDNSSLEVIRSSVNLGYFGRFTLARLAHTQYVWVMDDDVVPSSNWLEYMMAKSLSTDTIIASSGRIIGKDDYYPEKVSNVATHFVGDHVPQSNFNTCDQDTYVDFGCNSWLFQTSWVGCIWQIPPLTLATAEDIHFSAAALLTLGVKTMVPQQTSPFLTGNTDKKLGYDKHSSWKKPEFLPLRASVIDYLINEKNWRPISW